MKKSFIIALVLFSGLIFYSCEEELVDPNSVKPSVYIVSPTKNSVISDITQIAVKTFDNEKIVRLEIYINHNLYFVDNNSSLYHSFDWDTRAYSDGTQIVIDAVAYDNDGNKTESKSAIVYIYRFMPSNLTAQIESESLIHLEWRDNSQLEEGFEIYEKVGNLSANIIAVVDSNVTGYDFITEIDTTKDYYYLVRAFKGKEFSNFSNTAKAEIKLWPPENISGYFESDSVLVLNWEDNNDFEKGYRILINNSVAIETTTDVTTATIIQPFYNSNNYSINIASFSNFFSRLSETLNLQFKLGSPTELNLKDSKDGEITLGWQNNSEFECKFSVERKTELTEFAEVGITDLNITEFVDSNLDTNKTYIYRVKAITNFTSSQYSNEISVGYKNSVIIAENKPTPMALTNGEFSGNYKYFYKQADSAVSVIDVENLSIYKTLPPPPLEHYMGYPEIMANYEGNIVVRPYDIAMSIYGSGSRVATWDVKKGEIITFFSILCLGQPFALTSDNSKLLFLNCEGLVVYNILEGRKERRLLSGPTNLISNPSSNEFYSSSNGILNIYDLDNQEIKSTVSINNNEKVAGASKDGNLLLTSENSVFRIRNLNKSEIIFEKQIYNSNRVLISGDNRLLLTTSDNVCFVYDIKSGYKIKEFTFDKTIYKFGRLDGIHDFIIVTPGYLVYMDNSKQWLQLQ